MPICFIKKLTKSMLECEIFGVDCSKTPHAENKIHDLKPDCICLYSKLHSKLPTADIFYHFLKLQLVFKMPSRGLKVC